MKNIFCSILISITVFALFSCRGECTKCNKAGQQTLTYCEKDFTSSSYYHDQINGLDSLGYDCFVK